MTDLNRFVTAQDAVLTQVRAELVDGEKRSHWMWFVFPQIAGLGSSPTAQRYAIADLAEAKRYLADPTLGLRLAEMTQLVLGWAGRRSAVALLGPVDAMKFGSCMTLFERAALNCTGKADDAAQDRFARALDAFCHGQRDARTLHLLDSEAACAA